MLVYTHSCRRTKESSTLRLASRQITADTSSPALISLISRRHGNYRAKQRRTGQSFPTNLRMLSLLMSSWPRSKTTVQQPARSSWMTRTLSPSAASRSSCRGPSPWPLTSATSSLAHSDTSRNAQRAILYCEYMRGPPRSTRSITRKCLRSSRVVLPFMKTSSVMPSPLRSMTKSMCQKTIIERHKASAV